MSKREKRRVMGVGENGKPITRKSGKGGNLQLQQIMSLEKKFIYLLVLIHHALFLSRKMQSPIHKHSICIRDRGLDVLPTQVIQTEQRAGYPT
jgi:hypothetical protein